MELFRTVNIAQNKESLQNFHSQEEPTKTQEIHVIWNTGRDPGR